MVDDGNGGEKEEKQAEDKYEDVVRKLHTYFNPRKNLQFEIHVFRSLKQMDEETTNEFATRLHNASRYCEFHDVDREVMMQIPENGTSDWLLKKVLEMEKGPTLNQLLGMATAREMSKVQSKEMRAKTETVNQIAERGKRSSWQPQSRSGESQEKCGNCGRRFR